MSDIISNPSLEDGVSYKENVIKKIAGIKTDGLSIDFEWNEQPFILEAVCQKDLNTPNSIFLLAEWRKENQHGFLDEFEVTTEGTKKWLEHMLNHAPDRILFFVREKNGEYIGHVGLNRFDWENNTCEIDNIVRGKRNCYKGIIFGACDALMSWGKQSLNVKEYFLTVLGNNPRAINLYKKLNFIEISRKPLYREMREDGYASWKELNEYSHQPIENHCVTMKQIT